MPIAHKAKRCILHMGLAKTGTTVVQNFLFFNRHDLLKRWSILYPGKESNHFHFQTAFSEAPGSLIQVRRAGITDQEGARKFGEQYLRNFEKEFFQTRPETLLISSEYFSSMKDSELSSLREYLCDFCEELQLLIYVRDPWSASPSAMQQRLQDGIQQGDFLFPYTGHLALLKKFDAVFPDKINVRPYLGIGERTDAVTDFCRFLDVDEAELSRTQEAENVSIDYRTACLLSAINKLDPPLDESRQLRIDAARDIYRHAIIKNARGSEKISLSATAANTIGERAASDMAWVSVQYPELKQAFVDAFEAENFSGKHDQVSIDEISREEIIGAFIDALRFVSAQFLEERRRLEQLAQADSSVDHAVGLGFIARSRNALKKLTQAW